MKPLHSNRGSTIRSILTGILIGLVLAVTFVSGFYFRDILGIPSLRVSAGSPEREGYPLLDEVQMLLDRIYLREQPTYAARQYAAIRGVLATLEDPNTFFIEPPVAQSEADVLAGTYGGIGVLLQRNEAGEFVMYPFPDSPAANAGIVDGAILVAINGQVIQLIDAPDVVDQKLRGEVKPGSGVEITVSQGETEFTVFIEFAEINVPSVLWRVLEEDPAIGYTQILRFTSRTPEELQTAINELKAVNIQALVLDLRNNSGGLLEESIAVASMFLDGGVVTYEVTQDSERVLEAQRGGGMTDLPLVVLVNNHTASASELVAGAIRDRERGILIGQRTFGKGTVQQIFVISDGSSVHITSAEWFTPERVPLAGVGLAPNIEMIPDINGRDVELGEAIRYLQNELMAVESGNE
ncbi:MAG: S41 family peptidase [Chloroflexi bacterium]|nr:S41 family peptidase [Chloroflexota bacterium]